MKKEITQQRIISERDELRRSLRKLQEEPAAAANPKTPVAIEPFLRRNRGPPNPPVPITRREDMKGLTDQELGSFLYTNHRDQISELTVKVMLIRAERAIEDKQWAEAYDLAVEARKLARDLDFPPLIGRCDFWKGVAEYHQGLWSSALASFMLAEPCRQYYLESQWLNGWRKAAEEKLDAEVSLIYGTDDTSEQGLKQTGLSHLNKLRRLLRLSK